MALVEMVTEGSPQVARMSSSERMREAILRSEKYLPAEASASVKELLSPESIRIMTLVTLGWAISHFFGVGELADAVLLVVGAAMIGTSVTKLASDGYAFAKLVRNARSEQELDQAGKIFAGMVLLAGITAISALFMVKRPPTFKNQFFGGGAARGPGGWGPIPPRTPGWSYKPTTTYQPLAPNIGGVTTPYGDIVINSTQPAWAQAEALLHEQIHQMLTPKLYVLRDVRVAMAMEGYDRSYLLRYLEEAMAQTYALVKSRGPGFALEGIKFPVKNGYVTITAMGKEAVGVVLGPINLGGAFRYVVRFCQTHSHGASGSW